MRKRNIIGTILILAGIIVFMIPIGWQLYAKYQQKQMIDAIKAEIARNIATQELQIEETNEPEDPLQTQDTTMLPTPIEDGFSDLELETQEEQELEQSDTVKEILKYQKVIGIIEIKKIDIIFPIVEGAERENIRAAIGHIKDTAKIGAKGNCVLAGHRGGIYGIFFKHINKLKDNDVVKLTDAKGNEYQYLVYEQFVVEPTDMYVIEPIDNEKTLTLVSCEDDGTRRLIVRCRLKE